MIDALRIAQAHLQEAANGPELIEPGLDGAVGPQAGRLRVTKNDSKLVLGLQVVDLFIGAITHAHAHAMQPDTKRPPNAGKRLLMERMADGAGWRDLYCDTMPESAMNIWHFPEEWRATPETRRVSPKRAVIGVWGNVQAATESAAAAPAVPATLQENGFSYTPAEGVACQELKDLLRAQGRGPGEVWQRCVLDRRAFNQRVGEFVYTPEEDRACAEASTMLRMLLTSREPDYGAALTYTKQFRGCVVRRRADAEAAVAREQEQRAFREASRVAAEEKEKQLAIAVARQAKIQAAAQAIANDAKASQPVLSAMLCHDLKDRGASMAELAREKKYSKIGGVINLGRRSEIQDELAAIDDHIRRVREALRAYKRPAIGCKTPAVAVLASCLDDDPDERDAECSSPGAAVLLEAANILQAQ